MISVNKKIFLFLNREKKDNNNKAGVDPDFPILGRGGH